MKPVLHKFITREFAGDANMSIDYEDDLFASGLLDSLGVMRLIRFIEATYHCSIPVEDIIPEHFSSIQRISAYVSNQ